MFTIRMTIVCTVPSWSCTDDHAVLNHTLRRKAETDSYPSAPCAIQGPYAFSDISKLHHTALGSAVSPEIKKSSHCASSLDAHCDDYENVPSCPERESGYVPSCPERESGFENAPRPERESGFVTNDIYETCRGQQSRHHRSQTGWVENEIYG